MTVQVNHQQLQDHLQSGKRLLIDFYADWCAPCKAIAPSVDKLGQEIEGLTVLKLNIDQEPQAAAKFGVRSIPTLALVDAGEVVAVKVGGAPYGSLKSWVQSNLS